jgi:hypothetical protein
MNPSLLEGKTVALVDRTACNVWYFHCTDGSIIVVETFPIDGNAGLWGLKEREGLSPA